MTTERFHKAARDGYLDALKEATKRDLNSRDEDGMTPTLWAAFEGNLDALRLIVGRGGDPDKCDNYGNSALHFSAARGHMHCVSFLVNFGVNMWSLDIDLHSAKDLAAINNKEQILRFLDGAIAKEEVKNRKRVKTLQEKAEKEAEKRVKEFDKLQKKANKTVEEEQKKLAKQREKMERGGETVRDQPLGNKPSSNPFLSLRNKDHRLHQSPKFSEIVASSKSQGGTIISKLKPAHFTGVYKKVQQRKTMTGTTGPEFKVMEVEIDGKRSVRSLSGLRRDNEVMYVPKYEIPGNGGGGKRGKINGLFDKNDITSGQLVRSLSQPDYLNHDPYDGHHPRLDRDFIDDHQLPNDTTSIFERPGFGSVAFRTSLSTTLSKFERSNNPQEGSDEDDGLIQRQIEILEEVIPSDEGETEEESGPVELFLAAAGIPSYIPVFLREKIDLDTLILLTEEDLTTLGIPMGPRRKLLKSIQERQNIFQNPGEIIDSRL